MKVILLQDVRALGRRGDVKEVADGYARNFLFPKQLAQPADRANLNSLSHENQIRAIREEKLQEKASADAKSLSGKVVRIPAKAGEGGRLFGSVTSGDVAEALAKMGFQIDKRKIELPEAVKTLGQHKAVVKFYGKTQCEIIVEVGDESQSK